MKTLRLITLILVVVSSMLLSCYNDSGTPGAGQSTDISITDQSITGDTTQVNAGTTDQIITGDSEQITSGTTGEVTPGNTVQNTVTEGNTGLLPATAENTGENYKYTFNDKIKIPSKFDNTTIDIAANIFIPVAKKNGEIFPLIVFINSWAMEEHEYIVQAYHFAKKGYAVLSYSQRGWGLSGGIASLSGPGDWADFSNVLDWAENNMPIDSKNIGVSGISLGGGASLHAISRDPRVKTCAALSSYMDMQRSMYSQDTPRLFWGVVLVGAGALLANLDPNVYHVWNATLKHIDLEWLRSFLSGKSPVDYIADLNRMNKPVYISHNLEDYMFHPDIAIDYFNALTVDHKHMDLSQGTHATGEIPGLVGLKNYVYGNVDKWFDYWLKGIDTGIVPKTAKSAVVTMEEKNNLVRTVYNTEDLTVANNTYVWPAKSITNETMYCEPKGTYTNGKLSYSPGTIKGMNTIYSSVLVNAADFITQQTQAGCMIMPMLEQFKMPVITNLKLLNRLTTIVYEGPVLKSVKKIRGSCKATLRTSLSRSNGQVMMYLYDVNENGYGTFITHGFKTWWDAKPGYVTNENIPFVAMAYDVPAGHHIALVIDTGDLNYARTDWLPFLLTLHHGDNGQSNLTIPFEK